MFNKLHIESFCRSKYRRFVTHPNGCYLCWTNFGTIDEYQTHLKQHLENVKINGFNASWKALGTLELLSFNVTTHPNNKSLCFNLNNQANKDIKITDMVIYNENLKFKSVDSVDFPIELKPDDEVTLLRDLDQFSKHNHVVIVFEETSYNIFESVQSYHVMQILEEATKLAAISSPQPKPNPIETHTFTGKLELGKLSDYKPSVEIVSLYNANFKSRPELTSNEIGMLKTIREFKGTLTPSNYFDMLELMVQIEDYGAQYKAWRSTKENRTLKKTKPTEFSLKLHHSEGRPLFLLKGDQIWLTNNNNKFKTYGIVEHVTSHEILMKLQTPKEIVQEQSYSIHFQINRLTFRLERLALENAKNRGIIESLFPQANQLNQLKKIAIPELDIKDKRIKTDAEQMEAVHHIVAGSSYPLPYILIGFPGTGKTMTIVESIYQIWKTNPKNRILVCANANSVCDEIAQRLMKLIPTNTYNIIRLFAASVRRYCKNEVILENSNFDQGSLPCLAEICKYQIVVSTLTVAGRLAQANMDAKHFTHLFIDECESSTETTTLIPIALCSFEQKINAHIVLAGDPYQLGPVVHEDITRGMNMNVSLFQRLISSEVYQKNKKTNEYDRRIIGTLRNNYRSHPDLVRMPNKLFYDNQMKSLIELEKNQWLSELDILPKHGFPILFEHIEGIPDVKENCSSWYNDAELESVLHYIELLLKNKSHKINPCDIGVIAAYKRQVIHIEEALETHDISGIEVGTVEQFQSREKPIIIISTVRKGKIGFLKQRERINVMLTRAIGLLIIIGHTISLHKNRDWQKIIDHTTEMCGGEMVVDYTTIDPGDYRC